MGRRLWLRFVGADHCDQVDEIRKALDHLALPIETDAAAPGAGLGLVIADTLDESVISCVRARANAGAAPIVVLAAPGVMDHDRALAALEAGAVDVFAWTRLPDPARSIADRFARWERIEDTLDSPLVRSNLIGTSRAWRSALRELVEVALFSDAPVLLSGESGTGKELCARLLHTLDVRKDKRDLITVDCTLVGAELAGSELFGHERGSYTGATGARRGAVALADRGTLFLDEIGELPLRLQAELLRAVQEHSYKPVGADQWQQSDFRLVCATHRDLAHEEGEGRFRLDFYHRIACHRCHLPSLDERREDILPLARHFLASAGSKLIPDFDEPVARYLCQRSYRGNVRELRQLMARIALRHVGSGPITIGSLPPDERPHAVSEGRADGLFDGAVAQALAMGVGLKDVGRLAEEAAVRMAVGEAGGSLQIAARRLGVSDRALQLRRAQRTDAA